MALVIKNCDIVTTNEKEEYIKNGYIKVRDNIITDIRCGSPQTDDEDYIIDGRGSIALPGLINAHTHCSMTLLRGYGEGLPLMRWLNEKIWPFEAKLNPEDIYKGALLASLEMIKSGTTCFLDMYYHEEEVCAAVEEAGIRAVLGSPIIGSEWEKQLENFADFYKSYNGKCGGRINAMLAPHSPYTCSKEALKAVSHAAFEIGCGIHIHLSETEDEVRNIKKQYGVTPVEFLEECGIFGARNVVAAHCVHVSEKDMEILCKYNINAAHCPQSNMKLSSGISPVWRMINKGINVALGTDGTSSNNNLDMIEEMQTASYLQKLYEKDATALPPIMCLKMATNNGAKALGLQNEIGCIRPKMKADIILIDVNKPQMVPMFDPLSNIVYSGSGRDVKTVIADGKVVMENYQVKTLDEEKIMADAKKAVRDILGR